MSSGVSGVSGESAGTGGAGSCAGGGAGAGSWAAKRLASRVSDIDQESGFIEASDWTLCGVPWLLCAAAAPRATVPLGRLGALARRAAQATRAGGERPGDQPGLGRALPQERVLEHL